MENRRIVYDFCTRCGGLTKNGVCPTCQNISDKNKIIVSEVKTKEVSVPQNVIDLQTPQTQNYRKILTGIVIAVILFSALFGCLLFGERFTKRQTVGFAVGLVALLLAGNFLNILF